MSGWAVVVQHIFLGGLLSPIGAVIGGLAGLLPAGFLALVFGVQVGACWGAEFAEWMGLRGIGMLLFAIHGCVIVFFVVFAVITLVGVNLGNVLGYLVTAITYRILHSGRG